MAGFCGDCGTPRADGAKFCMHCGRKFASVAAQCPTCGQFMEDEPSMVVVEEPSAFPPMQEPEIEDANQAAPSEPPVVARGRGAYEFEEAVVFFDGEGWYAARQLPGDVWIPDVANPLPDFQGGHPSVVPLGPGHRPSDDRTADGDRGV